MIFKLLAFTEHGQWLLFEYTDLQILVTLKNIVLIFNYKKIQIYIFLSVIGMALEAYSISGSKQIYCQRWFHPISSFPYFISTTVEFLRVLSFWEKNQVFSIVANFSIYLYQIWTPHLGKYFLLKIPFHTQNETKRTIVRYTYKSHPNIILYGGKFSSFELKESGK